MSAAALHAALDSHFSNKEKTMTNVKFDIARALAEPLTGYEFGDLLPAQQAELMRAASAVMKVLDEAAAEREPLDPMRDVDFPFADNH
jgi:hypothetical protein